MAGITEEESEVYDKYFKKRESIYYEPSDIVSKYNKTFNITDRSKYFNFNTKPFDIMMAKYADFFEDAHYEHETALKKKLSHELGNLLLSGMIEYYEKFSKNELGEKMGNINARLAIEEHDFDLSLKKVVYRINKFYPDFDISNDMPIEVKMEALKKFKEMDALETDKLKLPELDELFEIKITEEAIDRFKDKDRYLPKRNITYREYLSLQQNFTAADFERTSFMTLSLPVSMIFTHLIRRYFR